jgi:hypothetical protein
MVITDRNRPMRFKLPDKDDVSLVPWEYIIDRLTEDLTPFTQELLTMNTALKSIDDTLQSWIDGDEDEDDGE